MKTNRYVRIMLMGLSTIVLIILRIFRPFTKLKTFSSAEEADTVRAVKGTHPEDFGINASIEVNGATVQSYERKDKIYISPQDTYTDKQGILTFRGDNLRQGGSFGNPEINQEKLNVAWSVSTGKLQKSYGSGYWTGSGWTGQPLVVRWSEDDKKLMNMNEYAKSQKDLAEVVYSTMDGKVYFLDAKNGEHTRNSVDLAMPFKGSGALDPVLPILYLGPGDAGPSKDARAVCLSLTDGSTLYEYGEKDPFAPRKFHGYDSSPLVFEDTLIHPGENGVLYTIKREAVLDENGQVKMNPSEVLKLKYETSRSSEESYWLGMEDSAVLWREFLFVADNGGTMLCININTMQIIWAQDVADDTNGSPVFSMEDGKPYIYIATSLHWKASKLFKLGDVPIFKIDALTGEYVWIRSFFCNTVAGVSGGIQATCALGTGEVDDLVFFPVARTPHVRSGKLVALDKKTGKIVWSLKQKRYSWSSPVLVTANSGKTYIVCPQSSGVLSLIEAKTGKLLDEIDLGSNIEASPAVFEDMIVIGTRGQKIFGVRID